MTKSLVRTLARWFLDAFQDVLPSSAKTIEAAAKVAAISAAMSDPGYSGEI